MKLFKLYVLLYLFGHTVQELAAQTSRPNIVFILADDMSYDALGFMGRYNLQTPTLDKLAEKGVRFTKSYNTTAICMASRAQLMTGLYEFATGTNFLHGDLPYHLWENSYPQQLRKAGYYVGFAGKFGFKVSEKDGKKGNTSTVRNTFDWWSGWLGQGSYAMEKNKEATAYIKKYGSKKEHTTHALGMVSKDFIDTAVSKHKPFCLSLSFKAPHTPYWLDPRYKDVYKETQFPKPESFGNIDVLPKQAKSGRPYLKGKIWRKDYNAAMYKYHTMVYAMDQAISKLLSALEANGVAENTIVIFTSDNGHFNGAKGMGGKLYAYEEGSLAPTIIYDPRRKSSQRFETSTALSGNIDITPTILDYAGIEDSSLRHGKSLVPILSGKKQENHKSLLLINVWGTASAQSLGVVTSQHKYIHWMYGADNFKRTEEVFNLKEDPYELDDISKQKNKEKVLLSLRAQYDSWLALWKREAIDNAGYTKYGRLADRHIPFESNSQKDIQAMYVESKIKKKLKTKHNKKPKNKK
ncbi:MAG: sulfatase-like hydrolase/transferase [Flavicella sp.]